MALINRLSSLLGICGHQRPTMSNLYNHFISFSSFAQMDANLDPVQVSSLNDSCIAVDRNDRVVGEISKRNAHLLGPNKELPPLHRAFSVFLFNSKNQLLLQQRSSSKITFPSNKRLALHNSIEERLGILEFQFQIIPTVSFH